MTRLLLAGPDHPEYGQVACDEAGVSTAVGLTRGWEPKPYAWVDPNEDVVAAVAGEQATMLVVADGHTGQESAIAAVHEVLDRAGPPTPTTTTDQLVDLMQQADDAVAAAVRDLAPPRGDSATTLVVALVTDEVVRWVSMGDSVLIVAASRRSAVLTRPLRRYVGWGGGLTPAMVDRGEHPLPSGAWVIAATDGYSDWAPSGGDLARATALWTHGAADAGSVVERLMDKARAGGAGDNVGIAVTRVSGDDAAVASTR